MSRWTITKRQTEPFSFAGKELKASVIISTAYEEGAPAFDYGSDEENAEMQRKFDNGTLGNFCVKVSAHFMGLEGTDYLGQVFARHDEDILETVEDYGMIKNAVGELHNNLFDLTAALGKA